MGALKLLPIYLAVYLVVIGQVSAGGTSSEETVSVSYDGVFGATTVKMDINELRAILTSYRMNVRDFSFPAGNTQTFVELGKLLKMFSLKAANVLIDFVAAMEHIVSTGNVPNCETFEHFEKSYQKLQKFFASDASKFAHQLDVLIGCPPSREFESIFQSMNHQIEYIARAINRIDEAVESGKDKREYVQRQAMVISNRVIKLTKIIANQFTQSVVQLASRIQVANVLAAETLLVNNTLQAVDGIINSTRSAVLNASISALDVYVAGQQSIKTNLSVSIDQLSVYMNFRVLGHLSHEIEESYNHLYHYLHGQNHSDIDQIKQYYNKTGVNSEISINKTTEILLDTAQRTVLEFIDFFLEGRFPDQCLAEHQYPLVVTYSKFTSSVTECLDQEKSFWNQTVQAFNASVNLLQSSPNEVAASIVRCAGFANCVTTPPPPTPQPVPQTKQLPVARSLSCTGGSNPSTDALFLARTKACLKTNLCDMHRLVGILKPQFEQVDRLIKLDVDASMFRFDNCLKTRLSELVAELRSTRASFRACMKQIDECPVEEICDDDESDWSGMDHGQKGPDSGEKGERKDSGEDNHEKELAGEGLQEISSLSVD